MEFWNLSDALLSTEDCYGILPFKKDVVKKKRAELLRFYDSLLATPSTVRAPQTSRSGDGTSVNTQLPPAENGTLWKFGTKNCECWR